MRLELCSREGSNSVFLNTLSREDLIRGGMGEGFPRVVIEVGARSIANNLALIAEQVGGKRTGLVKPLGKVVLEEIEEQVRVEVAVRIESAGLSRLAAVVGRVERAKQAEVKNRKMSLEQIKEELLELVESMKLSQRVVRAEHIHLVEEVRRNEILQVEQENRTRGGLQSGVMWGRVDFPIVAPTHLWSPADCIKMSEQDEIENLVALIMRVELAMRLGESAAEIAEFSRKGEQIAKAVGGQVDVESELNLIEDLMGLEGVFEKEDLLSRVRGINGGVAGRAGLNLDTDLHRMLLLDFLGVYRGSPDESW